LLEEAPTMTPSAPNRDPRSRLGPADADQVLAEARRLFQRTLSAWVCDLLELRKSCRDRPVWEPGDGEVREAA
jgi:hypothetical protein